MRENMPLYTREKRLELTFDGVSREFILTSLSAKDTETARREAELFYAETAQRLVGAAESIRAIYLIQDKAVLVECLLQAEAALLQHKAAATLSDDGPDYQERLQAKLQALGEARRTELSELPREELAEKLVGAEMDQRLRTAWASASLDATLALALRGPTGGRLFAAVDEMKAALPQEVLEQLYETLIQFVAERGTAQVFPKPHTSRS